MRTIYQKYNRPSKERSVLEKHLSLSHKWRNKKNLNFFAIGLLDHPVKVYHLCWKLTGLAKKLVLKLTTRLLLTKFRIFLHTQIHLKHPSVQPALFLLIGSLKTKQKLIKNLSEMTSLHLQPKYLLIKNRKLVSLLNLLNSKLKRSSDSNKRNIKTMNNYISPKVHPNLNQNRENSQQML